MLHQLWKKEVFVDIDTGEYIRKREINKCRRLKTFNIIKNETTRNRRKNGNAIIEEITQWHYGKWSIRQGELSL